jgi:hypothetical protein
MGGGPAPDRGEPAEAGGAPRPATKPAAKGAGGKFDDFEDDIPF